MKKTLWTTLLAGMLTTSIYSAPIKWQTGIGYQFGNTIYTVNGEINPSFGPSHLFKNNHNASVQSAKSEGKNYTASQVILFLVAIFLYYGILTLMTTLFPIMSFAIAIALSVLIWIPVFIVLWLILLMIK